MYVAAAQTAFCFTSQPGFATNQKSEPINYIAAVGAGVSTRGVGLPLTHYTFSVVGAGATAFFFTGFFRFFSRASSNAPTPTRMSAALLRAWLIFTLERSARLWCCQTVHMVGNRA